MNINGIIKEFPILNKKDKGLVYLDNAATSQRPKSVIAAIVDFYENHNSNVHRGVYSLGEDVTSMYESSRGKVAKFINASDSSEIIFTKGTTEGINFISNTWGIDFIKDGDEILITQAEHHANFLPWQRLATESNAKLKFVELDLEAFRLKVNVEKLINDKTKLVAVTHSSNVLGDIWDDGDLDRLIQRAHEVGAKVLLDIAQSVPHRKIDVQKLNCDFAVFSGHKMLAPTGIGVLYIKKDLHDSVRPYQLGGSMVHSASIKGSSWAKSPQKYEAGTPPIAQAIGLGAAIDFFEDNICFDELQKHDAMLCERLIDGLLKIDGMKILGDVDRLKKTGHMISFSIEGVHAHDLATFLSEKNISVRAGHHCAQPLFGWLCVESALRVSFYMYNTEKEVDLFLDTLNETLKFLGK